MAAALRRSDEHFESDSDVEWEELHSDWRDAIGLCISEPRRHVGSGRSTVRRSKLAAARESSRSVRRCAAETGRDDGPSAGGHGQHRRES